MRGPIISASLPGRASRPKWLSPEPQNQGTADNHKATVPTKVRPKTRIRAAQSVPLGEIGGSMGKHSTLTVDGSQIGGYKTGIWQGDESVGHINNSQIGADQSKLNYLRSVPQSLSTAMEVGVFTVLRLPGANPISPKFQFRYMVGLPCHRRSKEKLSTI
jgi:hypothetical protein